MATNKVITEFPATTKGMEKVSEVITKALIEAGYAGFEITPIEVKPTKEELVIITITEIVNGERELISRKEIAAIADASLGTVSNVTKAIENDPKSEHHATIVAWLKMIEDAKAKAKNVAKVKDFVTNSEAYGIPLTDSQKAAMLEKFGLTLADLNIEVSDEDEEAV